MPLSCFNSRFKAFSAALFCFSAFLEASDLTILQINDVYEISAAQEGKLGGLARVAGFKKKLESQGHHVIIVHAGDFLSPSAMGQVVFEGKPLAGRQMVDILNQMGLKYATFGNHEFDLKEQTFVDRIQESHFTWISSNVHYVGQLPLKPILPYAIYTFEQKESHVPLRIGFIGLTTSMNKPSYVEFDPVIESARKWVEVLKPQCDMIIAITHLPLEEDALLAQAVPEIDLILGGHDHENCMQSRGHQYTPIAKADANAYTVYMHEIIFEENHAKPEIISDLKVMNEKVSVEPATGDAVRKWEAVVEQSLKEMGFNAQRTVIHSPIDLDGREITVRHKPGVLSGILAKALRRDWPQAQLGIYNSGAIRLDDLIAKGPVKEYDIFRVLPFGDKAVLVEVKGDILKRLLRAGVRLTGTGGFLQYDGATPVENCQPESMQWNIGKEPLDVNKTYLVACNGFLIAGIDAGLEFFNTKDGSVKVLEEGRDWRKLVIEVLEDPSAKKD